MNEKMSVISYANMREMLKDCLCEVQANAIRLCEPEISSGFYNLDDLTGGLEKGKVYVIGGRPCMGKEEFMLSIQDLNGLMKIYVKKNALKPLGSFFLEYNQDTGSVSLKEDQCASKPVSLKDLGMNNKAVKSLIKAFDLEEVLP